MTSKTKSAKTTETEQLLDDLRCPGIYIEVGNIGTISDFYLLTSEEGQEEVAQKISNTIRKLGALKQENNLVVKSNTLRSKMDSLFVKPIPKKDDN